MVKKDLEKEKLKQGDIRDDLRIKDEMKAMAIAEGMDGPPAHAGPLDVDSQLKLTKESSAPLNPHLMASQATRGGSFGLNNGSRRTAYAAN